MDDTASTATVDDLKGSVQGILTPNGQEADGGAEQVSDSTNAAGSSASATSPTSPTTPSPIAKIGRDVVMRVPVTVQVVLGKLRLPVSELMQLSRGSVLALDRSLGEPVDLVVNGHLVARGQIVVVEDKSKRFGISLTEIVDNATGG